MIAAAAVVLAILPFVFFRGRELARALTNELALYAFAIGVWVFAGTVGANDFDPYIAIVFVGVAQLALIAIQITATQQLSNPATRFAIAAALVYAVIIPTQFRSALDGDEPFYLLVTESIVHDHDLDLANQYRDIAKGDTGRPDLGPQLGDPTGPHGEQYSRHEPFLPLLMVPGYALFGVPGAIATIALFGVLLVRSLVRWLEDEGISDATIRALMPLIVFGPPVVFYAVRIWPEVPAAFCFVEALRGVRQQRAQRWIPALFALVMLKLRFVLIGVTLVPFILRGRNRNVAALALAILALPLLVVWLVSGSATNVHTWRELIPVAPMPYFRGLFGLLLDGATGLAFQAPLFLLGIFALARWQKMPEGFRLGAIASLIYVVTLLPRSEWHGGWSPPLRYIVVFIPLLALGAAALYEQSRAARALLAPVAVWTIGLTVHGIAEPWRLFHIANGENAVGEWLSAMQHTDFSRLFPSYIRSNFAAVVAAVVFVAAFVVCRTGALACPDRRGRLSYTAPPCAAILLALFFHFGRLPGDRIEFEDAHVIHNGGELYPYEYQVARFIYRGGWLMKHGDSLSFLAKRGSYVLFYASTQPAVIDLGGHAFHLDKAPNYAMTVVDLPVTGRVTLRCLHGSINLDRMDRRD
jgi:hypothetical protein